LSSAQNYKSTLDEMIPKFLNVSPSDKIIFPGILMNVGDYLMDENFLIKSIKYNRKKGYAGEVFFFYEGLRKNNDQLGRMLLRKVYNSSLTL